MEKENTCTSCKSTKKIEIKKGVTIIEHKKDCKYFKGLKDRGIEV